MPMTITTFAKNIYNKTNNTMKATKFLMMFVATAAMMFASCGKDDNENGGGSQLNIPANTLVYDGVTYTFDNVYVDYMYSGLTGMEAYTNDTLDNGEPMLRLHGIHITPNVWNRDFDLADLSQWPDEVSVNLVFEGVLNMAYTSFVNGDRGVSGRLDGEYYEEESIFTSGTYRVSGNNDGTPITVTVDGVLRNGKTLQMKLVSGNYNVN